MFVSMVSFILLKLFEVMSLVVGNLRGLLKKQRGKGTIFKFTASVFLITSSSSKITYSDYFVSIVSSLYTS